MLRTRHLSLATRQSKLKAKECVDSLQPFKERPETSAIAARRLVSGALGIKTKISREERDMEKQKIKKVKGMCQSVLTSHIPSFDVMRCNM